jgi:hypothetical protein
LSQRLRRAAEGLVDDLEERLTRSRRCCRVVIHRQQGVRLPVLGREDERLVARDDAVVARCVAARRRERPEAEAIALLGYVHLVALADRRLHCREQVCPEQAPRQQATVEVGDVDRGGEDGARRGDIEWLSPGTSTAGGEPRTM